MRGLDRYALLVGAAGLVLSLFVSRWLAENLYGLTMAFAQWPVVASFAVMGIIATIAFSRGYSAWSARRLGIDLDRARSDDAFTYLPLFVLLIYLAQRGVNTLEADVLFVGALAMVGIAKATRLVNIRSRVIDWVIAAALFIVPFAIYLQTLLPSVGTKDGFELQVVAYTLGVMHPTGYPLITLLGKLFTLLPIGSVAYRINLMDAFFAALTIPLIYSIIVRVTASRWAGAVAALLFAFSPTFWAQASIPEKYTLNVLFVAAVMLAALWWAESRSRPQPLIRFPLAVVAFVYGLSLTHHRTMILLAPVLALWVALTDTQSLRRPKELLVAAALFTAPLLLYAYIPLSAYAQGWAMTRQEFLAQVSGSFYSPALRLSDWLTSPERLAMYGRFLSEQFGPVGIGLGIIGLGWLTLKQHRFLVASLVAYAAYTIFAINYHAYYNDANFFLPSHLFFAMWIGAGLVGIEQALCTVAPIRRSRITYHASRITYWALAALLPMSLLWSNWAAVDQSRDWAAYRWGKYVLDLPLTHGATILADTEKFAPLYYLNRVEGVRPDVKPILLGDEAAYRREVDARVGQGQPVYLARFLPNLADSFHLRSVGPLVEVAKMPLVQPPTIEHTQPLAVSHQPPIELLGYNVDASTDPIRLTLFWRAKDRIDGNYHVHVRLVGSSGHVWLEESNHPVTGEYPTSAWRPGEIVPDYHELAAGEFFPPGTYCIEVGLSRPFSSPSDYLTLTEVQVGSGHYQADPPHAMRANFADELMLVGYDAPGMLAPDTRGTLTLFWQKIRPSDAAYDIAIAMLDHAGQMVTSYNAQPFFGEYPTSRWPIGGLVATRHEIAMPAGANEVTLRVGLRRTGGDFLPVTNGWLATTDQWVPLPSIRASESVQVAIANFDDRIALEGYELARRDSSLEITLTWRCLRRMDEDYTLFVHVLDANQKLWGQIDTWPRDGTYPTSRWKEGETIRERYVVPISAQAPPGEYQVEVGWYLLATMRRLPVLGANGMPIDDRLLIPGIEVH